MSRVAVTVLYEDQRDRRGEQFGLHRFAMACLFDRVNGLRYDVEARVDAQAKKGAGNLLRACREDAALIAADGRRIVAVFDDDHVRDLLGRRLRAGRGAADEEVVSAILDGANVTAETLQVILLRRSTETVLEAVRDCDPSLPVEQVERAIRRKDLTARDLVLVAASRGERRAVRDCVLAKVPSFSALVDHLEGVVRPLLAATEG